jgi:hypothetical protein
VKVIDAGSCVDEAFTKYLADLGLSSDFPDGWYFSGPSYSPLLPTDKGGVNTYLQGVKDFAPGLSNFFSPFPQYAFAAVMTVATLLNGAGPEVTKDSVKDALESFAGPYMMTAGDVECGREPSVPAQCTWTSGMLQFKGDKFVSIRSGATDNPLEIDTLSN